MVEIYSSCPISEMFRNITGLGHGVGYHARNISSDIRKISFLTSDKFTL